MIWLIAFAESLLPYARERWFLLDYSATKVLNGTQKTPAIKPSVNVPIPRRIIKLVIIAVYIIKYDKALPNDPIKTKIVLDLILSFRNPVANPLIIRPNTWTDTIKLN